MKLAVPDPPASSARSALTARSIFLSSYRARCSPPATAMRCRRWRVCPTAIEAALTGTFEFHVQRDLHLASRARKPRSTGSRWINQDLHDAEGGSARHDRAHSREERSQRAGRLYALLDRRALRLTQMVDGNKASTASWQNPAFPERVLRTRRRASCA